MHSVIMHSIRERNRNIGVTTSGRPSLRGDREVNLSTARAKNRVNTEVKDYNMALNKFAQRVGAAKAAAYEGKDGEALGVFAITGRRFDKVFQTVTSLTKTSKPKLLFFVERETGNIYGIKSENAPNLRHYFGTVYKSAAWNWSGDVPEPTDLAAAGVVHKGGYGDYQHYEAAK